MSGFLTVLADDRADKDNFATALMSAALGGHAWMGITGCSAIW